MEVPDRDAILGMIKTEASKKIARLLGLARRAGKVSFGRAAVKGSLEEGRVSLLLLARDAFAQDLAALTATALASGVPSLAILTKGELGDAVGRRELTMVAVKDPHFAQGILRYAAWIPAEDARAGDRRPETGKKSGETDPESPVSRLGRG